MSAKPGRRGQPGPSRPAAPTYRAMPLASFLEAMAAAQRAHDRYLASIPAKLMPWACDCGARHGASCPFVCDSLWGLPE